MKNCYKCGIEIKDGFNYCDDCYPYGDACDVYKEFVNTRGADYGTRSPRAALRIQQWEADELARTRTASSI